MTHLDRIDWHDILRASGWTTGQIRLLEQRVRWGEVRQERADAAEQVRVRMLCFALLCRETGRLSDGATSIDDPTLGQVRAALNFAWAEQGNRPAYTGNPGSPPADEWVPPEERV